MIIVDSANTFNLYHADAIQMARLQMETWDICNENIAPVILRGR